MRQPCGIGPSSDSSKWLGKRSIASAGTPTGVLPSRFATTGSKSTNQDVNSADAKCFERSIHL